MGRIGIDIVEVAQVEAAISTFGDRYLRRIYTDGELGDAHLGSSRAASHLAARFAAKEALLKVLSAPDRGIDPRSIEVVRGPDGAPRLALFGSARELAHEAGITALSVSLSHDGGYATAVVLAETHPPPT